jgi:hypothetical protein
MNPSAMINALEETLHHFGSISNNLVYVTEELPSLTLSKGLEERIVMFSCDFLEFLASYDSRLRNLLASLGPNPAHGPIQREGFQLLEDFRRQLWVHVEGMHVLITDVRSQAAGLPCGPAVETLLNESGANILKAFLAIRELIDPLAREMEPSRKPS